MPQTSPELRLASGVPDRMIVFDPDLTAEGARYLATDAVFTARQTMPRVTGASARRLAEASGPGWFGIYFPDAHTWYMEQGTKAHTMRSLAGKVIPMWVADEDGSIRSKNPKARTRTTEDGRLQVLIFRKAAQPGQRKTVKRRNKITGVMETRSVPLSYPGAPGRIANRSPGRPNTPLGETGGGVQAGNVGVRWRHPGVRAMGFLNAAITMCAFDSGIAVPRIYVVDGPSFATLMARSR
jgi:hypothetical protein